ncbi:hypothetical protein JCM5296_001059 [Sporobolomyces johnsonii]
MPPNDTSAPNLFMPSKRTGLSTGSASRLPAGSGSRLPPRSTLTRREPPPPPPPPPPAPTYQSAPSNGGFVPLPAPVASTSGSRGATIAPASSAPRSSHLRHHSVPSPSPSLDYSAPLRANLEQAVPPFFRLLETLREESLARPAFELPDVTQDEADDLRALHEAAQRQRSDARKLQIKEMYRNFADALAEGLSGLADQVNGEKIHQLGEVLRQVQEDLYTFKSSAKANSSPSIASPLATPLPPPPPPARPSQEDFRLALARISGLEKQLTESERIRTSMHKEFAERLAALEKPTDPRRRPGSTLAGRSISPLSPQAQAEMASKEDVAKLKDEVAALQSRVGDSAPSSSVLGKRRFADGADEPEQSSSRVGEVSLIEEVAALRTSVSDLGREIGGVASQSKDLKEKLEASLSLRAMEVDLTGVSGDGRAAGKDENEGDENEGGVHASIEQMKKDIEARLDRVDSDVLALKTASTTLPPANSPSHPDKLHQSLVDLGSRVHALPALTPAHFSLLDVLQAFVGAGPNPTPVELATLLRNKLSLWESLKATVEDQAKVLRDIQESSSRLLGALIDVQARLDAIVPLRPAHSAVLDALCSFVSNNDASVPPDELAKKLSSKLASLVALSDDQAKTLQDLHSAVAALEEFKDNTHTRFGGLSQISAYLEQTLPALQDTTIQLQMLQDKGLIPVADLEEDGEASGKQDDEDEDEDEVEEGEAELVRPQGNLQDGEDMDMLDGDVGGVAG